MSLDSILSIVHGSLPITCVFFCAYVMYRSQSKKRMSVYPLILFFLVYALTWYGIDTWRYSRMGELYASSPNTALSVLIFMIMMTPIWILIQVGRNQIVKQCGEKSFQYLDEKKK